MGVDDTTSAPTDKAKKGEDKMVTKLDKEKILKLEKENIALKSRLKESSEIVDATASLGGKLASEMKKIRAKGRDSSNTIDVISIHDHKNISLWRKDGKRLGPMHPSNAIQTLNRFADLGILLSADRPTAEQIAAYKETKEYKIFHQKEIDRRARKDKSRTGKDFERLVTLMEKQWGVKKEDANKILSPQEVGSK